MSKRGAVFLTTLMLATTPVVAAPVTSAEVPHRIVRDVAWGCRDKNDLIDLLFLGLGTSFENKLAQAVAEERCAYFTPGENVTILQDSEHGLVKVQRGGAAPVAYWTPLRNVD